MNHPRHHLRASLLIGWCVAMMLGSVVSTAVAGDAPVPVVPPPIDALPPIDAPLDLNVAPPGADVPAPAQQQIIIPEGLLLGNGAVGVEVEDDSGISMVREIPPPHAPAKPAAFILRWDRYRTLVVIDTSAGLVKPCWIVTLSTMPEQIPTPRGPVTLARGQVVVSYRGQAYLDKDGVLHVDARRARKGGTMADNWSPDSFAVTPTKEVTAHDDDPEHPSNTGEVEKEVSAETQRDEYRRLLFTAMTLVEGNI